MKIAYDCKLKRPGCVLIQAALGCDFTIGHRFPSETWLVDLTADMRVYEITEQELERLVKLTVAANAEPSP